MKSSGHHVPYPKTPSACYERFVSEDKNIADEQKWHRGMHFLFTVHTMPDKAVRVLHIHRRLEDNENKHVVGMVCRRARTLNATWTHTHIPPPALSGFGHVGDVRLPYRCSGVDGIFILVIKTVRSKRTCGNALKVHGVSCHPFFPGPILPIESRSVVSSYRWCTRHLSSRSVW